MSSADPFDLERFTAAQAGVYPTALAEIRAGRKVSHWMWFVFPQLAGLGGSSMAQRYAIRTMGEARAYLDYPVLGSRLREISQATVDGGEPSAHRLFGSPDDLKLRSSMTLFAATAPDETVFGAVLDRFFEGAPDPRTLALLRA